MKLHIEANQLLQQPLRISALTLIPHSALTLPFMFQKEDDRMNKANELSLANVGGVFVVLLAGMGIACLIAVFEFIWKSRKLATEDNVRHSQLICKALSHTNTNTFHVPKLATTHYGGSF